MKEAILCPSEGYLFHYLFWENGHFSGGGRRLTEGYHFTTLGPAVPAPGIEEQWQIRGEKVKIKYRIVTDQAEIKRLMKEKIARLKK